MTNRRAMVVMVLLITLAVPTMHSLASPSMPIDGVHVASMSKAHVHPDAAALTTLGMTMDGCATHPCVAARTGEHFRLTPPTVSIAVDEAAATDRGDEPPVLQVVRAPPREGSCSRFCVSRT